MLAFFLGMAVMLVVVVVCVLLTVDQVQRHDELPTSFSAGPLTLTSTTGLSVAQRKANRFWRGTRCSDAIQLERKRLPADRIATAHWYYNRSVPSIFLNCKVVFQSQSFTRAVTCAAMIHEYGHLNGRAHSRDPRNVMYPTITSKNIPRVCR